MSDRELLEKAAKAAGLHFHGHRETKTIAAAWVSTTGSTDDWFCWNPLTDDGDALRLKVRLCLVVGSYEKYSSAGGTYTPDGYSVPDEVVVWHHETGGDACAAERLAITRCAAAISELMP